MAKRRPSAASTSLDESAAAITTADRRRMIAEAAYYRALDRGFVGGNPEEDWLQAEQEINEAPMRPAHASKNAGRAKLAASARADITNRKGD